MLISFPDTLLLETGDKILLETGDAILREQHSSATIDDGSEAVSIAQSTEMQEGAAVVASMSSSFLALYANAHFGPDATGDFIGGSFDITEKSGEFEVRNPL